MPAGTRLARYRADRASYQAALINGLEADQDVAVNAVLHGIPSEAWQEPAVGCGYQIAAAVHTMNQPKTAFRLSLKREERHQGELFDEGTMP